MSCHIMAANPTENTFSKKISVGVVLQRIYIKGFSDGVLWADLPARRRS